MLLFPIVVSLLAVLFVAVLARKISQAPRANDRASEIGCAIRQGAVSYLRRQGKTLLPVALALFCLLGFFFGWKSGLTFLLGALT
jgi:K(+)-stimulated pyrophosphate-energized sodium pump